MPLLPARRLGLVSKELSACGMEEPWAGIQGPEEAQLCVVDMPEPPRSPADTCPLPRGKLLPGSQPPLSQVWVPIGLNQWVHLIPATMTGFLSFFFFFSSSYVPFAKPM